MSGHGTIPSGRKLHVSTGFDIVMADCSFLKEVESEYEIMPASSLICKDLFKKESRIEIFERMKVILSTGEHGVIEQSFGKGGKARIAIPNARYPTTRHAGEPDEREEQLPSREVNHDREGARQREFRDKEVLQCEI
ncbi:unnamed protein product, partial [Mesorhabditis spiculigera]